MRSTVTRRISILVMSRKQGFWSDPKTHIGHVLDGYFFFLIWHMDRIFLFLARKKIIKFYTYINVIRVKNENCEFPQKLCTDFLGCLLCFPQNKTKNSPRRNLETPSRSQVGQKN